MTTFPLSPILSLLALAATLAAPNSEIAAGVHPRPFPDDYTPSVCAPANSCDSFLFSEMQGAAISFLGLPLDSKWIAAHHEGLMQSIGPVCRKHGTCLATPGNNNLFCDDVATPEFLQVCDKDFPLATDPSGHEQCLEYVEVFALGVDQHSRASWLAAQACANEKTPPTQKSKPPVVWIEPASLTPDHKGYITIYALDPDTHVPVQAKISVEGQILYSPTNPAGDLQAYYPFTWPLHYVRTANSAGHTSLAPPKVTVSADHYPSVTFPMPVSLPTLKLRLVPPVERLRRGKNTVTVMASDSVTGKPVELRVMFGDRTVGTANEPIELEIARKGRRPEIWVTSLFDRYSDATVVPAEK